jgi:predicted tellurium resistance membrane protein TerC
MIELLQDPNAWFAFLTLTVMEIVLGIDNIVFISVIVSRLPEAQAARARALGLSLALVFRIVMLLALTWIIGLTEPVFTAFGKGFSWRDLILMAGGLFLIYKATSEVHAEFEYVTTLEQAREQAKLAFNAIIAQIVVIDLVFSVDSIVTAIGMADHVEVMIAAVIVAVAVMYLGAKPVSEFIKRHPTTKMLALAFLLLIGASLVADGLGFHIPRGYIYFAMAFSALVETVNIALRSRHARKH